jgi:hypothetical protein
MFRSDACCAFTALYKVFIKVQRLCSSHRFQSDDADLLFKVWTNIIATAAQLTVFDRLPPTIAGTYVGFYAFRVLNTGIISNRTITGFFENRILFNFPGNGGTVFAKPFGNLADRFLSPISLKKWYNETWYLPSFLGRDTLYH